VIYTHLVWLDYGRRWRGSEGRTNKNLPLLSFPPYFEGESNEGNGRG